MRAGDRSVLDMAAAARARRNGRRVGSPAPQLIKLIATVDSRAPMACGIAERMTLHPYYSGAILMREEKPLHS